MARILERRTLNSAGGPGDIALQIAAATSGTAPVVVADLTEKMLEVGKRRAREVGVDETSCDLWRQMLKVCHSQKMRLICMRFLLVYAKLSKVVRDVVSKLVCRRLDHLTLPASYPRDLHTHGR